MTWTVEWTHAALKDARRLDAAIGQRVVAAIQRLTETGEGDVKRLKGRGGLLRLRVGDWRVLYEAQPETQRLFIVRILHRGDVYR